MRNLWSHYINSFRGLHPNIWVLSITMLVNRSGSMVMLFTSLYMSEELNFSLGKTGVVMSFFGLGSILGSYVGGWLTDRYNPYRVMLFSLLGSACIVPLLLLTTEAWMIASILLLFAMVSDAFRPANSSCISAYSTTENRTRSVTLVRLAVNLGLTIGPAVGGFIAMHLGYTILFLIDSVSSILAAILLMIYLPMGSAHRHAVPAEKTNTRTTSAYKDQWYLLFILMVSLYAFCFFQLIASVPQYFSKELHYETDTIGLLLALNALVVVLIEMPIVSKLESGRNRFRYIIWGTICIAAAFAILWIGNAFIIWAIAYTLMMTFSEIFAMPFMMNISLSRPDASRKGQYSALYSIAYGMANIAAPIIGLGIADRYGFEAMFAAIIVLSIVIAFGFRWLAKHSKR